MNTDHELILNHRKSTVLFFFIPSHIELAKFFKGQPIEKVEKAPKKPAAVVRTFD